MPQRRIFSLHRFSLFASLALTSLVVACGGGSGGSSGGNPSGGPPATLSTGTVQFTVTEPYPLPVVATGNRSPQFSVPPSTQSISVLLNQVSGSPPPNPATLNDNLGANAPGCTVGASTLTCQFTESVPAGTDSFSVLTYSQPNENGNLLGGGSLDVDVIGGQTVQAPATLTGTVASIAVSVVGSVPEGVATALPVDVVAKDGNGNTIIGNYSNPISLADSDTSGATVLSVKSLSTSGAVTLTYNGSAMNAPASISASAMGVPSSAIAAGSFLPQSSAPTVNGATLSFAANSSYTSVSVGSPGPTPTPMLSNWTSTTTYTTGASFSGLSGLVKVESAIPIPSASPSITDSYYEWVPGASAGSWAENFIGFTAEGNQETCVAPYSARWIVPLPSSWNDSTGGPCTESINFGSGSFVLVQNADGSYSSTETLPSSGETNTILVRPDGTALMTSNDPSYESFIVAIGTPAPGASSIPLEVQNFSGAIPSPGVFSTPAPVATSEPNWYATVGVPNGVVPSPLSSGSFTSKGVTALPTQCAVPATILGASPTVTEVDYISNVLDPTGDYNMNTERSFIVNGIGDVCDITVTNYYSNLNVYGAAYNAAYEDTTDGISTSVDYLTTSTLKASMAATRSFAAALPSASQMLVVNANAVFQRARLQAEIRGIQLRLRHQLELQRG